MTYTVTRIGEAVRIDANWEKKPWQGIPGLALSHFMGDQPEHIPAVQAKLAYDDASLYVIFRVEDRYVRAVETAYQGSVCRDSCAEFFFTPGTDTAQGYFNIETNCSGTLLLNFQRAPGVERVEIPESDGRRLTLAHSLSGVLDPEVQGPLTWTLEYRLPFEVLTRYTSVDQPRRGVVWKGNLYKCADKTSHPHWLTWSVVPRPRPNFHVPEGFGELVFG